MYRIVIIEDTESDAQKLKEYIAEYGKENKIEFTFKVFSNALDFFDAVSPADILFLDMEMPYMNGLEVANRIRTYDKDMVIIFYSAVQKYALDGYSVEALDFLLKPATLIDVFRKMERAVELLKRREKKYIYLHDERGMLTRINLYDIAWIEKEKNQLVCGVDGKTYRERRNMYEAEQLFADCGFAKCRSGVMVNLRFVREYDRESVLVDGKRFWISRGEHKAFFKKLLDYFK